MLPVHRLGTQTTTSASSMPTSGPPTTWPPARSTSWTIRCCVVPSSLGTSSPVCLGHWGTSPGLNFCYAHLSRCIKARELDALFVCGPGHGAPAIVANTWLEGTYSERYPHIARDGEGMARLFRQFSFPGGIPSHTSPQTPGSIHEGGELGYSLSHAFGAAFDNPDLVVACVVGDGEAETGPAATGWHSNKFLDPCRDGVVLPILHLNGYKIAAPTVLARIPTFELLALFTRLRLPPGAGRGRLRRRDSNGGTSPHGSRARRNLCRDQRHPELRSIARRQGAPRLAHAHLAHAQGLDGSQSRRRAAH